MKKKKPSLMAPLLPLGFILVYQVDAAYGTLVHRTRGETAPPPHTHLREAAKLRSKQLTLLPCCTFRGGGEHHGVRAGASADA